MPTGAAIISIAEPYKPAMTILETQALTRRFGDLKAAATDFAALLLTTIPHVAIGAYPYPRVLL